VIGFHFIKRLFFKYSSATHSLSKNSFKFNVFEKSICFSQKEISLHFKFQSKASVLFAFSFHIPTAMAITVARGIKNFLL
jgi:hypothetical protein